MRGLRGRCGERAASVLVGAMLLGFLFSGTCFAAWDHYTDGAYEVYYLNTIDNIKFRYQGAVGQWGHYSSVNSTWYTLSATGLTATFIGDGNWYNLGTGLKYRYAEAYNFGYFSKGAAYRFYYRYGPGQWYTSGYGGGWYVLGTAGRVAGLIDGNWYDLGTGLNYKYTASFDFGYFTRGAAYRFYYKYGPGQWYTSGYGGGWQLLGLAGRSAGLVDGNWYDLGTGLSYRYDVPYDFGYYRRGAAYRFYYRYGPGQWYTSGYGGGWYQLGATGRSAGLVDGNWYDLGTGLTYRYAATLDFGYFGTGSAYRFYYRYGPGQWYDAVDGRAWMALGATEQTAAVVCDGSYHALGAGYQYMYGPAEDRGYFFYDTAHHFRQLYTTGAWEYLHDTDQWSPWAAATLVGEINPIGNSSGKPFVVWDGFTYFAGYDGTGYDVYRFDGSSLTDISGNANFTSLSFLTAVGSNLYWVTQDASGREIFLWNGASFTEISGNGNFTGVWYQTTSGTDVYLTAAEYAGGDWQDFYLINGSSFTEISGNRNFYRASFQCQVGSNLYFTAGGSYSGYIFRWDGGSFTQLTTDGNNYTMDLVCTSGSDIYFVTGYSAMNWVEYFAKLNGSTLTHVSSGFGGLECVGSSGADYYFLGSSSSGSDLYKWNGSSFSRLTTMAVSGLDYIYGPVSDMYFIGKPGGYDLYHWDGSALSRVSSLNLYNLNFDAALSADLYFTGRINSSSTWDLYRWNGSSLSEASSYDFDALNFIAALGSDLIYRADRQSGRWDLYRWSGTTLDRASIYDFSTLDLLSVSGTDLYFSARDYASGRYDIYRWRADSLTQMTDISFYSIPTGVNGPSAWYLGDLLFWANGGSGTEPWRYWTHWEILSQR